MSRLGVALLFGALTCAAVRPTGAATYFVAPAGSDANDGLRSDAAHAFRTIQHAVDHAAPGDTVLVRAGVYREKVVIRRGGDSDNRRITLRAAPGEKAVLDGTGVTVPRWEALLTLDGCAYVTVADLEVRHSAWDGISVRNNAIRARLERLSVHDSAASGLCATDIARPAYTYIRGGEYYRNRLSGILLATVVGGYFVVERNSVHDNQCEGNYDAIQTGIGSAGAGIHHAVIRWNRVYDNRPIEDGGGDAIDMGGRNDNMSHLLMEGNLLWGTNGLLKFSHTVRSAIMRRNVVNGSAFIDLYGPPYPECSIYHNTLYGGKHGIQFGVGLPGTPQDIDWGGLQIRNNLFVATSSYALNVWTPGMSRGAESLGIDGNLYNPADGAPDDSQFAVWRDLGQDAHSVVTHRAASAILRAGRRDDLRLPPGSPAIDAGLPLTRTRAAGSGRLVPVERTCFFQDGYDGLIAPDIVQIGKNPPVAIVKIDEARHTLELSRAIRWAAGDPVSQPWIGKAPDIGAEEWSERAAGGATVRRTPNGSRR